MEIKEKALQKITPNLWFSGNAKEAVDFYASVFPDTNVIATSHYPKTKEEGLADFQLNMAGKVLTVDFEIMGFHFVAINAGPEFTPNPSVSFILNFVPSKDQGARENLDKLWEKFSDEGKILMPLQKCDFSERFGWLQDKYSVSWQFILLEPKDKNYPFIVPSLFFVTPGCDRAEEATDFYLSVFKDSMRGIITRYPARQEPNKEGAIMFTDFMLENQWFAAMDGSAKIHKFKFNEGISLSVACQDQSEIDYYWEKLTADGGEESVCGWLKDKYGVSWQIEPANIGELIKKPGAFANMMKMKKIIIKDLHK